MAEVVVVYILGKTKDEGEEGGGRYLIRSKGRRMFY